MSDGASQLVGGELYGLLGLDPRHRATYGAEELKRAYRKTLLATHPDKRGLDGDADGSGGGRDQRAFLEVQRAWETLNDPAARYRYDDQLLREEEDADEVEADKEVDLSEMRKVPSPEEPAAFDYEYACRCGDTFVLQGGAGDLPDKGTSVLIPCCSCSLILCVTNN